MASSRQTFRALEKSDDASAIVDTRQGPRFCSGGDVQEIIGPLTKMHDSGPPRVHASDGRPRSRMRDCPQPSSRRSKASPPARARSSPPPATSASERRARKTAFIFPRVGLLGRGHGRLRDPAPDRRPRPSRRAALHRPLDTAREGARLGFLESRRRRMSSAEAHARAEQLARGPPSRTR